jgi:hypothetical protein
LIDSFCDRNVKSLQWALKLHKFLKSLSECNKNFNDVSKMLIDLENCKHCNNYSLKCNDVNNCGDIYHVLNNLSEHLTIRTFNYQNIFNIFELF